MRYAIYYTPPREHPLTQAAANWLGRDAFGALDTNGEHGFEAHVGSPRRYGFHGTLKAPFRLAPSVTENDLLDAFDAFLTKPRMVPEVTLTVGALGPFLALVPNASATEALQDLARDCVHAFEPFRAALTEADMQKRNPHALSSAQLANLCRYGYPYVLEEFRFHMTLTSAVADQAIRQELHQHLSQRFDAFLKKPLRMNTLAIFVEDEPGADFVVLRTGELTAIEQY